MKPEVTQVLLPEDKPVPRPEDFIGQSVEGTHIVEGIEAIGSKFVVFRLRNLATGEVDQVLKVLRQTFDPCTPLLEALPQALREMPANPDRVIRICDRLLALDPKNEAAAFDRGVALLSKKETIAALEAFNLALEINPADVTNLVHRAACFAELQRDEESLRDFQAAADLDNLSLKKLLAAVRPHAITIGQALTRLAKTSKDRYAARQLLRAHFAPVVRVQLFVSNLFS